jgi:hypothetical protein
MKNMRHLYGIFAFAAMLALTSCHCDELIEPNMKVTEFDTVVYELDDLNRLANPELSEASETQVFAVKEHTAEQETQTLRYILKQLNLDATQRTAIRGFAEEQATCLTDHRARIKERHDDLIKRANAVREEHIKEYRAGNITKAQLEERLTALRTRLQEHLQSDEQKLMRLRMMTQCRVQLFKNIASVLTQEQRYKFNRWRESLK